MKTSIVIATVTLVVLFVNLLLGENSEELQYELIKENVKNACVLKNPYGYYLVNIKLKEKGREYFAELTGNNIGKKLVVTFSGKTLISAVIKARVDSGIIQVGGWGSEEEAREFVQSLSSGSSEHRANGREELQEGAMPGKANAEDYLKMALDSFGRFSSTKDKRFLIDGLELVEKAISLDSSLVVAYYWKAMMFAKLKKYEEAIGVLASGIEKSSCKENDDVVNLYFLMGVLKQKMGDRKSALNSYRKARQIYERRILSDARDWDALMNLSLTLTLMGKKGEALEIIKKTIREYPNEIMPKQILRELERFDIIRYLESI